MSTITAYQGPDFLIEQYPDGICVLLRNGNAPFYADDLSWFDSWGDDIDLTAITPRKYQRPEVPAEPQFLAGGYSIRPVQFLGQTHEDLPHCWGFALQDSAGNVLGLSNLYGEVLYPLVTSAYCLYDSPEYHQIAQGYFNRKSYPSHVPAYVQEAMIKMPWQLIAVSRPTVAYTPPTNTPIDWSMGRVQENQRDG